MGPLLNPIFWTMAIGLLLICLVIAVSIAVISSFVIAVPVAMVPILTLLVYRCLGRRRAWKEPSSVQVTAAAVTAIYLAIFLFGFLTGFLTITLTGLLLLGCCVLLWLWDVPLAL